MQTPVNSLLLPQTYDLSALNSLYARARHCAAQQSIAPDDHADCAQVFILCFLKRDMLKNALSSPRFANHCAMNFARNRRRSRARLLRHETTWPQQTDEEGKIADQEFVCPHLTAHATAVRREAGQVLSAALLRLTTPQRSLVVRHYVEQQSFVKLAEEIGSTPDAVRMTIVRACKRLRVLLCEEGMTEEDAREYLLEMGKRGGGDRSRKITRTKYFVKNFLAPVRFLCRAVLYRVGALLNAC